VKTIGNFQTGDPLRLSEQLDRFQDAVDQETKDIRATFLPQLEPRVFMPTTPIASTLLVGQMALCDSGSGNVVVTLSAPPGKSPSPGWLAVVKRFAANSVAVRPSGMNGPVARRLNAVTGIGLTLVGLRWIYFDGADWWA
jgi:hypothetical protein